MEPRICCSSFCNAKAIRTTSSLHPGTGRDSITQRSRSRNPITSSMCAISPPRWALRPTSNSAPAAMVPAMRSSSTCAIPMDTASNCSIPTTRSWIWRTSRCAGTQAAPCNGAGRRRIPELGVFFDHDGEIGGRVGDTLEPVLAQHLLHVRGVEDARDLVMQACGDSGRQVRRPEQTDPGAPRHETRYLFGDGGYVWQLPVALGVEDR